ncbi:uncharacterized protein LOC118451757 [Egretta garzetta]|uniref:uncharacterized protein LOC118451757 n=1 Tax=Egretta garzetta TaxID=188379 RepID=UPI00163C0049|nr:uncharacterized protein LOC118451757 [Egretta garzetta]
MVRQKGMVRQFAQAVGVGRARSLLLALRVTRLAPIDIPGEEQAMVSTRLKAVARKNVATQTESPPKQKHAAVQVVGHRECLSLSAVPENGKDSGCLKCEQLDDLLCLVAELKEEVEKGVRWEITKRGSKRITKREPHWVLRSLLGLRAQGTILGSVLPKGRRARGQGRRAGGGKLDCWGRQASRTCDGGCVCRGLTGLRLRDELQEKFQVIYKALQDTRNDSSPSISTLATETLLMLDSAAEKPPSRFSQHTLCYRLRRAWRRRKTPAL